MIGLILNILALSSGSVLGSLYKKRYEETLPITAFSIIIILYIFYLFNLLYIGTYLIWAIIFIIYIYFSYKIIKKNKKDRQEILNNLLTPGFIIFILLFLGLTILTRVSKVMLWDELRLWGAYPKILYYNGNIQLGSKSLLAWNMQSYEPGMPLFMYFLSKTAGYFSEERLFLHYGLLSSIVLMPLTKNITWKKWYLIPIYTFLIFTVPLMIGNSNYDGMTYLGTLFIDPMLGIYFAYNLYLAYKTKINDKFELTHFILTLLTLTLLKDTGILFASISALAFIIINIPKTNKTKHKALKLILPIILVLTTFISWKVVQKIYDSTNMYTSKLDKTEIISFFTNRTEEQQTILNNFKQDVKTYNMLVTDNIYISNLTKFPIIMVALTLLLLIISFLDKENRKKLFIIDLSYVIGSIIFILGTLFVYIFSLKQSVCFPRYMTPLVGGGTVLICILLSNKILNEDKLTNTYKALISVLIITAFYIYPFRFRINTDMSIPEYESKTYTNNLNKVLTKDKKYALVFTEESNDYAAYSIYYYHIYFEFLDRNLPFPKYYFIKNDTTIDSLIKEVKDTDYLYFINVTETDIEKFNQILSEPITESTLFEVQNNNLIKVNLTS